MFADGEGRKDLQTQDLVRDVRACPRNRLVHVAVLEENRRTAHVPRDPADVIITYAAPHHLNADACMICVSPHPRRRRLASRSSTARSAIDLGIPNVGAPVRYSLLRPAPHLLLLNPPPSNWDLRHRRAEEPLDARRTIRRAAEHSDRARVCRSPAIRGLCGLL